MVHKTRSTNPIQSDRTITVSLIGSDQIEEGIQISGWVPGKTAGGDARTAKLAPDKRAEIASRAAKVRWSKRETDMMSVQTKGAAADSREAVRMYPNNSLREPVRDYSNKLAEVVRNTFTK